MPREIIFMIEEVVKLRQQEHADESNEDQATQSRRVDEYNER